jgi:tripartite-type tricarboxylate transporter receptor subunit TctC
MTARTDHPSSTGVLTRRTFISAMGALPLVQPAAASSWPERPVTIVVPAGSGTGPDIISRRIAELVSPHLAQPMVVDNRPGGAGLVATERVAHAAADGHMLLLGTNATICINPLIYTNAPVDVDTAFQPVCMLTRGHPLLVVSPDFPASDIRQFVARAKSGSGQVTYASAGPGSASHLAGALLASVTGTSLFHVPYKDEARAITDVIGGQVHCIITFAAAVAPHVQAGRLKALAIAGTHRSPLLANVRTSAEQGYASFDLSGWLGIFAPSGVPAERLAMLERELVAAARSPSYTEWVATLGSEAVALPAQEFAGTIKQDRTRYASLLRVANVTPGSLQ